MEEARDGLFPKFSMVTLHDFSPGVQTLLSVLRDRPLE
jgi:hypothetical protein